MEFLPCKVVLAAGKVAQSVGVEGIRGRRGASAARCAGGRHSAAGLGSHPSSGIARACGRRGTPTAGDFGVETLHGVLYIHQRLLKLAEARLTLLHDLSTPPTFSRHA